MSGLLRLRWMCVLALVCTIAACGSDASGEGEELPMPISEDVSADDGADIETQGVAISIPGGALTEDTEVTLEVILPTGQPEADKLVSLIYDFGPDGTTFEMPVELSIDMNKTVPEGMEAKMAWLDEAAEKWVVLADSQLDGMTVTATTDHFTMFAIVLTAAGQTGGTCEAFADWEACGGDIEGTWEFSLGCVDLAVDFTGEDGPFGECPTLVVDIDVDFGGTATFEASGAYAIDIMRASQIAFRVPSSCIPSGAMCSQLASDDENASAELDGDVCVLTTTDPAVTESKMGMFELDGDTIIMMDTEDTELAEPQQYCVEGDTLTLTLRDVEVDEETGEEQVIFIQATRQ